jgi:hypothetical protein
MLYGGRFMSNRRKPRVVNRGYEVTLVERPPPSPPRYELVEAWPHDKHLQKTRGSRMPIIISSIALLIAILSLFTIVMIGVSILSIPQLVTTATHTVTKTTTYTSVATAITTVPGSCPLIDSSRMNIQLVNLTVQRDKRQLISTIKVDLKTGGSITEKNFTVRYIDYDMRSSEKYGRIENVIPIGESLLHRVNCTLPDLANDRIYIVDILFKDNEGRECIIARFYV